MNRLASTLPTAWGSLPPRGPLRLRPCVAGCAALAGMKRTPALRPRFLNLGNIYRFMGLIEYAS